MKLTLTVAAACLVTLAGCSPAQGPSFVLVADAGQIGQGAKIILQAGSGTITMAPIPPAWPAGFNDPVEGDAKHAIEQLGGGHMWSVKVPSKNLTLTFVFSGNHYICESCGAQKLPIQWTKQGQ